MTRTDFQELVNALDQAFSLLGANPGDKVLASLAHTLDLAMSGEGRYYHTTMHALAVADLQNPIQTLAALFHDLVYVQIDPGFPAEVWETLSTFIDRSTSEPGFQLIDPDGSYDRLLALVKGIFGFSGARIPDANPGTNEFLSALVMVKKLSGLLPERTLFRVVALIEATIPFRADDERGAGPFEHLAQRLVRTAEALGFPISQQEADETVHWAVALANRDVANFSNNDPVAFLESTWTLLPESNPSLRRGSVYLIGDYRRALESMRQFLSSIPAENVLHAYKGVPPDDELEAKLDKIRFNLALSVKYFDLKLLCMAVLEALAHTTGGDVPVFQFLGDITIENASGLTGLFSTGTTDAPGKEPPTALIKLLQRGVRGAVDFTDVRTAPLAVYLYQQLDPQMLNAAIASAHELFAGRINPGEFLSRLDQPMLAHIIVAVAQIAVDRREKLENIAVEKIIH